MYTQSPRTAGNAMLIRQNASAHMIADLFQANSSDANMSVTTSYPCLKDSIYAQASFSAMFGMINGQTTSGLGVLID